MWRKLGVWLLRTVIEQVVTDLSQQEAAARKQPVPLIKPE